MFSCLSAVILFTAVFYFQVFKNLFSVRRGHQFAYSRGYTVTAALVLIFFIAGAGSV